jgi:uncharacterized protein YbjT (DUF2867 family)
MILVTGSTGFIGKALIRQLVQLGHSVKILLRPSTETPRLPKGVPVEAAVCSLFDERGLRSAMNRVNYVYHLASAEHAGLQADFNRVDIEGTRSIAKAAAEAGVERFFFLSHLGADRSSAFPLLKAKAIAESAIIQSGVPYSIFRSGLVFGPGDYFTRLLRDALKQSPGFFILPDSGKALLQPLWVEDLVTCLGLALDDSQTANQTISIGGQDYLTFREIVELILAVTKTKRALWTLSTSTIHSIGLWLDQIYPSFPLSLFWLDYLAADRICALDTLPRIFGLMPARISQKLDYLS